MKAPVFVRILTFIATGIVLSFTLGMSSCIRGYTNNAYPQYTVSAGAGHSCRTTLAGTVECWGANFAGQTGNGRRAQSAPIATEVPGLRDVTLVSAGIQNHTCALANSRVLCWGLNNKGQLGSSTPPAYSSTPVDPGLSDVIDVSAGGSHSCAVLKDGSVRCWGDNSSGQLGNGTQIDSSTPVVAIVSGATRVAAGLGYSCAIVEDGGILCWGLGWLGTGIPPSKPVLTPQPLVFRNAVVIAAGLTNTCVVNSSDTVWCWGPNSHGELGDGDRKDYTVDYTVPGMVSSIGGVQRHWP